jgi:hypothetical protein
MKVLEVKDGKTEKDFLDVVDGIYAGDKEYVRPLDADIKGVFDPENNGFFKHGEASRFVLYDAKQRAIGRVAAFINTKKAFTFDQPTGGLGFFECINDKEAAYLLFDTGKKWLEERKMEAMDAPINFGENDRFWGLLIDGFSAPSYGMAYNPPYYQELFESYGFKLYYEMISNHLSLQNPFPERFSKIANWVMRKEGYRFEHFKIKEADRFTRDLVKIYNEAWQFHENFTPLTIEDVNENFKKMKPIIQEQLIWFAYVNDEPSGFMIMIPDVNQIIRHLHGKLNLVGKLKFAYHKWANTINRARLVMMGVVPKHQKAGLESAMIISAKKAVENLGTYDEVELSWVGDFNPKMRALQESVGASFGKKHYTYRMLFKSDVEVNRSSVIARDTKEQIATKKA